ncbi:hypothetical protein [Desulfovirgula thermocuniculi]|uniref:hypothetical protein n=1 Tax=Desulfovirgula thermocuniculi TaxID=348842 RepID=UPI00040CA5B8|nr:hypothetical protein [Desulfovirgula thermocuniculi]
MPVPVFLDVSFSRIAAGLSLACLAREMGIAQTYLYYLEEFKKVADVFVPTHRGKSLFEFLCEYLRKPILLISSFPPEPHQILDRVAYEKLFHACWPYLSAFLLSDPFWEFFFHGVLTGNENEQEGEHTILAPLDKEAARALWFVMVRAWGPLARRKKQRVPVWQGKVSFIPFVEKIDDVVPGKPLGRLCLAGKGRRSFKEKARLLFYLYVRCFAFADRGVAFNGGLSSPAIAIPGVAVSFHFPFPPGAVTVLFEKTSEFRVVEGDFLASAFSKGVGCGA